MLSPSLGFWVFENVGALKRSYVWGLNCGWQWNWRCMVHIYKATNNKCLPCKSSCKLRKKNKRKKNGKNEALLATHSESSVTCLIHVARVNNDLFILNDNIWSEKWLVTKWAKREQETGEERKEERNEQSRGVVTFSSGGWREPSLLVKEELFHPAITQSLSPH